MFLDLTKYKCPITFVKAKIALEKLQERISSNKLMKEKI